MFDAKNIGGDTWLVTKTDAKGALLETHKVAVKAGDTGENAIAAIEDAASKPSSEEIAAQAMIARVAAVKVECGRRIYMVADQVAQMNMTAAASAGRLSPDQMASWRTALQWVDDMRAACPALIGDAGADHLTDKVWPVVPGGVADLAAKF